MTARLSPYLGFRDQARAAMTFYGEVLGSTPTFTTFDELGMAQDPADADKILHSALELPGGDVLMASDAPAAMPVPETSAQVALAGGQGDAEHLRAVFARLSEDGQVTAPLAVAPWGDEFGMCTDRFGIAWMVSIARPAS